MFKFIFFIVIIFIILRAFVSKNSDKLLSVNPYIQIFIAFPITFALTILISNSVFIGLLIYTVTMYLGLVFQEYYQKFSFTGEQRC